jgi:hypothetical protein
MDIRNRVIVNVVLLLRVVELLGSRMLLMMLLDVDEDMDVDVKLELELELGGLYWLWSRIEEGALLEFVSVFVPLFVSLFSLVQNSILSVLVMLLVLVLEHSWIMLLLIVLCSDSFITSFEVLSIFFKIYKRRIELGFEGTYSKLIITKQANCPSLCIHEHYAKDYQ